jgi:ribosomal protein S18 acetylase RimI-like enzyme
MEIEGEMAGRLAERQPSQAVWFDGWTERKQDEAATLIASAYQGHIDSEINDQYRSPAGARRFLMNIVQYPGCGSFFQPASFVAIEPSSGRLAGICLASLVQADVGHVTQVCVSKAARGTGVGYELIRRSLNSLVSHGCRKVTLTVTASNTEAIGLYERMGFHKTRNFAAYVWDTGF